MNDLITHYPLWLPTVLKATCIKQSPAFISDPIKDKEVEIYLY